jgi:NADH-quinone oxidoreductase subunit M
MMNLLQSSPGVNPFAELSSSFPLLSLVTFLPLLGVVFIACIPRANAGAIRATGIFVGCVTFLISLLIWRGFGDVVGFQLVDRAEWVDGGIGYLVGVDGISLFLVLLTTFLTPLTLLSATKAITDRTKEFVMCMLLLETGMLGALLALDLFLFYVFWEAMLIPMYLLIGIWGGKNRIYATMKFFLYTMVGSVLMLVGIIYLYLNAGGTSSSFAHILATMDLTRSEQLWLFGAFGLAFAIKVPLFPFHTWLPDAHTEAPTAGSVILAGVLLKLGTYGLLRFAFPLFPEAVGVYSAPIMVLAVVGILYGAFVAYNQTDVKRLVAYSSVSHLGFVVLGMFAMTHAAVEGSILQMVNHGISTGGLFLCVGILYERRHTRLIEDYGGIAKQMPRFAVFFMIMTLASIGLPGTNGFVGEFLILAGTFQEAFSSQLDQTLGWVEFVSSWRVLVTILATLATLGVVFGAVYMLSVFRRVMFGPIRHDENKSLADLDRREVCVLMPLAALIFIIGFFPNVFLSKTQRSVTAYVDYVRPAASAARQDKAEPANEKKGGLANVRKGGTQR